MLYAGSDGKGTIYSVKTEDGAATVIYQTGQKEVRRLVMGAQKEQSMPEPSRQRHRSPVVHRRLPVRPDPPRS